ncbi:MAG: nucleotidyltransferase domain-containing protein [Defluviitaleaceae bacterium]|nr:nucleotidyltransferase domain-containing protein [Defluviitaleaceae bacterium]
MRTKTFEYFNRLRNVRDDFPPFVSNVIFFGSEVYGSPTLYSDIDIAVEVSDNLSRQRKDAVYDIFDLHEPPYDYHLVWIEKGEYRKGFDVRKDIYEKGWYL